MIRIATWNVWNDADSSAVRMHSILQNLKTLQADILALQEVTPDFFRICKAELSYPYAFYHPYPEEQEGLALFSHYEFRLSEALYSFAPAMHADLNIQGHSVTVTNVHLPWDSVLKREKQILFLDHDLNKRDILAHYRFLLGDFNSSSESSVHRFLTGEQSLCGREASPVWLDLKAEYTQLTGIALAPTLDCLHNSRWEGKNRLYGAEDFDRIYLQDRWNPFSIVSAGLIGTQKDPQTRLHASDHYGVWIDFELQ